jgi:hypothetical protein
MMLLHQAAGGGAPQDPIMEQNPETTASPGAPERLTRPQAIQRIRETLGALTNEENCTCAVAARYGVLCGGFTKLPDREFRSRFAWIANKRRGATRDELEHLVSAYHMGRQQLKHDAICCDTETREHCVCDGWNQFDNAALEKFCLEITGSRISID